jgi:hypothetical protein
MGHLLFSRYRSVTHMPPTADSSLNSIVTGQETTYRRRQKGRALMRERETTMKNSICHQRYLSIVTTAIISLGAIVS